MQEALGHIQVSINLASIQSQLFGRSHLHVVGRGRLLMDHWRVARGATLNIAGVSRDSMRLPTVSRAQFAGEISCIIQVK